MRANESLLELFLELQNLDRVPRMGYALRGVPAAESVAEHSLHVALLVWALAPRTPGVDRLRALELALVHDLAELRTGDLPMTAARYLPAGAKQAAESAVLTEMLAPVGPRAAELVAELARRDTPEARFVKACDKLQLMLKVSAYERAGVGVLEEFWEHEANFPDAEFPAVREVFEGLRSWRSGTRGAG